jgi:hypothetical protein
VTGLGISRRLFLRKAVAVAPMAMVGTGAAGAAVASVLPGSSAENPALLALDEPLQAAETGFLDALARKEAARVRFLAMLPPVPPELIASGRGPSGFVFSRERHDFDGNPVLDETGRRTQVYDARRLRRALEGMDGRTRRAKHDRARMLKASALEDAEREAYSASGFKRACYDAVNAEQSLGHIATQIRDAEALTLAGLAVKARAVATVDAFGDQWRYLTIQSGPLLAASIMAIAGATSPPPLPRRVFDYEGAISKLEALGFQLAAVLDPSGKSEGYISRRPDRSVPPQAEDDILSHRLGFSPYRLGEVLAGQGKLSLPPKAAGVAS